MYNIIDLLWGNSMKILIDVYGGDYSPDELVKGAIISVKEIPDLELILTGKKDEIGTIYTIFKLCSKN